MVVSPVSQQIEYRQPNLLISGGPADADGFTVLEKPFDQEKLKRAMETPTGSC